MLGDVTLNGKVELADAIIIQKNHLKGVQFTGDARKCADVDGNGTINLRDAILIQRYVLGLFSGNTYGIGEYIS